MRALLTALLFAATAQLTSAETATAPSTISAGHISVIEADFINADTKQKAKMLCAGCHGEDGSGDRAYGPDSNWGTPMIRGLKTDYFQQQLKRYRSGERIQSSTSGQPGEMNQIMASEALSDEVVSELANYYASLSQLPLHDAPSAHMSPDKKASFDRGEATFNQQCIACHGAKGQGLAGTPYPHLAGQIAIYVEKRLKFYSGDTSNQPPLLMTTILSASPLSDQQIQDIGLYLENLVGPR